MTKENIELKSRTTHTSPSFSFWISTIEDMELVPSLKRVWLFLEDEEWEKADEYCERVLDQDPECAVAYLGKLMAELKVTDMKELADYKKPFDQSRNYAKILRFGSTKLSNEISGIITNITERLNSHTSEQNENGTDQKIEKQKQCERAPVSIGDTILLGSCEQGEGTSAIEWLVLAQEESKMLIISKYGLDVQPYNTAESNVTWETCSLRAWLNETFYGAAFTKDEQTKIDITLVKADKNPQYDKIHPGNATSDKIFLLSVPEVYQYFNTDEAKQCVPTAYAKAQGSYTSNTYNKSGEATCSWWLRSPGGCHSKASFISTQGTVSNYGKTVTDTSICVRPAMWVNLDS